MACFKFYFKVDCHISTCMPSHMTSVVYLRFSVFTNSSIFTNILVLCCFFTFFLLLFFLNHFIIKTSFYIIFFLNITLFSIFKLLTTYPSLQLSSYLFLCMWWCAFLLYFKPSFVFNLQLFGYLSYNIFHINILILLCFVFVLY